MEQEETKGCSGQSVDTPDLSQGLCTISLAKVSHRAVSMSTVVKLNYNSVMLFQGGDPKKKVKSWGQEWHKEEREAQED